MRNLVCAAIAVLVSCFAGRASAQTFSNVQVEGLPTVYVTDRTGQETVGKLVTLTESAIVVRLKDNTTRTFRPDETTLVERRGDSLKNGTIIGAIFGGVMGTLTGGMGDCPDARNRSHCPGTHVAVAFLATGIWAAIGAGIDAAIPGRTRIWPGTSSTGAGGALTVAFAPQRRRAFIGWRIKYND